MSITSEIIKKFARHKKDTGSSEIQISLLSYNINNLARHLKTFKKDHEARRQLLGYVNKRKKLSRYFFKKNTALTQSLMKKFNIKKL